MAATDAPSPPPPPFVAVGQDLLQSDGRILGQEVAARILPHFPDLLSSLPRHPRRSALASIDGRRPINHDQVHNFVEEIGAQFHRMNVGRGHRIALLLPNGPELALAIFAIATYACCVPLNANGGTREELEADIFSAGCDLIIGIEPGLTVDGGGGADRTVPELAQGMKLPFCGIVPDSHMAGMFVLRPSADLILSPATPPRSLALSPNVADALSHQDRLRPNGHDDTVLVLFTSGTTGSKKLVPHILQDLLVATSCIIMSWQLSPNDTNCNLMPLFHVGGIIRQVFSPLLSGGCVICCPSFDQVIFWELLQQGRFNWYYAAPTMHHMILQTGKQEGYISCTTNADGKAISSCNLSLRMIANAAGGLLPSLAQELRQTFSGVHVLPSYGMTECMPISSPPASYDLDRPGTSGVAVGPEMAILNTVTTQELPRGQEGPICVRGPPCFRGYGQRFGEDATNHTPASSFLPGGWFNTGDLGYMDQDGFVYITGRSKEVINRGGEIISPLEVEEAVNQHPDVAQSVVFSAAHDVLQEVVAVVLVMQPGRPRLDLQSLHNFLSDHLTTAKWPQCIVFMDGGVPKSHTNKVLRVKLGERLSLPELTDKMTPLEKLFEAKCPKQGTDVSVPIECHRVTIDAAYVEMTLKNALAAKGTYHDLASVVVRPHPTRFGSLVAHVYGMPPIDVVRVARANLEAYLVPSHVCTSSSLGMAAEVDPHPEDSIASIEAQDKNAGKPQDPLVATLQEVFFDMLDLDGLPSPDSNFFNLGGSSLLASQLASKIRKEHKVIFGGAEVFRWSTCEQIADVIRERQRPDGSMTSSLEASESRDHQSMRFDFSKLEKAVEIDEFHVHHNFSSTAANLVQLVPIFVLYPIWQVSRFLLFFRMLLFFLNTLPSYHHLIVFILSIGIFHACWLTFTPLIFVVVKWIVIGRYEKGRYKLWGNTYLRWWLVDVLRKLTGKGVWGCRPCLLNAYYRMLGAHIGRNAKISLDAEIAEYDLVYIGDDCCVDYSVVRGFGVDHGAMIMGPVRVGHCASVGARSIVAPFTSVRDNEQLAPSSSSYDVDGTALKHRRYNRQALPEPNEKWQMLVGRPILFFVDAMSQLPAIMVLYLMVHNLWHGREHISNVNDLLRWLCNVKRLPYFVGVRLCRAIISPIVYMAFAILVKRTIVGKFREGPRDVTSQWQLTRHYLAEHLFTREKIQDVADLIGRHYELVSIMYRLMGAKVGKRVFWPGRQPITTGQFDLIDIGDDVVFGSRSAMFVATTEAYEKVTLCAGANVSDNTVVLPGAIIGKNAVLGSNSLCPAGAYLPEESVWFGARGGEPVLLQQGVDTEFDGRPIPSSAVKRNTLEMTGNESTLRPFGKAFYQHRASYRVFSLSFIVGFTIVTKTLINILHTAPLVGALYLTSWYLYGYDFIQSDYQYETSFGQMYWNVLVFFAFTHAIRVLVWVAIEVSSKWIILGRRQPGRYNYDEADYAQRWELYQLVAKVRSIGRMNLLDFLGGTPYLVTFYRWLGSRIGKGCCLYPSGADPFVPEPDLVTFGDNCVIDCASIVCHLNTRGNFELRTIHLDDNVTLRSRSRVQQGVVVERGSMVLEKSLVMTGEVVDSNSIWQGAPALHAYNCEPQSPSSSTVSSRSGGSGLSTNYGSISNTIV